jgi:hypothetical protein
MGVTAHRYSGYGATAMAKYSNTMVILALRFASAVQNNSTQRTK